MFRGDYKMQTMTAERALNNAIISTQMEGFVVTDEQKVLLVKLINKEITLDEALKKINAKYKD